MDITSPHLRSLAEEAASWNERLETRENGNRAGNYAGGSGRSAALLDLLIARGLPEPNTLLHQRIASLDVLDTLMRLASPTQPDIDAALRHLCSPYAFTPDLAIIDRLLAAGPSQGALDDALQGATRSVTLAKGARTDKDTFTAFEKLLDAGARADHGAGTAVTALHHVVGFAPGPHEDAIVVRALQSVSNVDVTDAQGVTPLHVACSRRLPARVRTLVAAGADPQRRSTAGQTAVDFAERHPDLHAALGVPPPAAVKRLTSAERAAELAAAPPDPFAVGCKVTHAKFGAGDVTASTGSGAGRKLTVTFASGETRTLAASFLQPAA